MKQLNETKRPCTLLVGARLNGQVDFEASMRELADLVKACDMEPAARVDQNLSNINAAYYIGLGKVNEIKESVEAHSIDCVVFNDTLSPTQLKNLQKGLDVPVWDRTYLILEIFSRRARTKEANMQVESARLQYMLPRLMGLRDSLGRQGGASGSMSNKGSGEKQMELDRRNIEGRISELRRELARMEQEREVQRRKRSRGIYPQAALVGYTNAGKSTLLNKLVELSGGKEEKMVMAKDLLFATLDTTVRKISPGIGQEFLLSDTVGFISRLPHGLVKAFRSTLDEIRYADLLLHVVDVSDEHCKEQMEVTEETLNELGAGDIPRVYIMNKADSVMEEQTLPKVLDNRIYMSAKHGIGIPELICMIEQALFSEYQEARFLIPYEDGGAAHYFNSRAIVHSREFQEEGVLLSVRCRAGDREKYKRYLDAMSDFYNDETEVCNIIHLKEE